MAHADRAALRVVRERLGAAHGHGVAAVPVGERREHVVRGANGVGVGALLVFQDLIAQPAAARRVELPASGVGLRLRARPRMLLPPALLVDFAAARRAAPPHAVLQLARVRSGFAVRRLPRIPCTHVLRVAAQHRWQRCALQHPVNQKHVALLVHALLFHALFVHTLLAHTLLVHACVRVQRQREQLRRLDQRCAVPPRGRRWRRQRRAVAGDPVCRAARPAGADKPPAHMLECGAAHAQVGRRLRHGVGRLRLH
eukprot:361250-Chlamydomonas_euryale.AAC.4